ncbi:alpha/beta fold hydrolase [Rhodanobacter sp. Col0626]|uniref:alpha/beta fold hydrolase n=1 Tax=Rhodanobacter sp. Col0626 TaxID=3415679 RepID=UPI003CE6F9C4
MKLLSCKLAALSAALLLAATPAHAGDVCVENSATSLDALTRGDFADARAHFNATLGKQLDAAKLKQAWAQLQASAGAYGGHAASVRQLLQGEPAVVTPITFAKMSLDLVTSCDAQGPISHYRFLPASMVKSIEPVKAHVEADGVRVSPLDVPTPIGPLHGALTLPKGQGPFPAVVLVAGSGAHDMDETLGPNKPFRDIANALASDGIASLRYDKRTFDYMHWSGKGDPVIDAEVTDDAVAAARLLAKQAEVDSRRVFVLGHSLGAMMAPRIGRRDSQLAGLVLMAAPARRILDVMEQQARYLSAKEGLSDAATEQAAQSYVKERKLLAAIGLGQPAPLGEFDNAPQTYWLSWSRVDPVADAKSLAMPMLILQGGGDFQISPMLDFARWKQLLVGRPQTAFHLYPGLSHLFMPAGKTGTVADYQAPGHVDAHVIGDIVAWIKMQPPAHH